ncbi:MAG: rane protein [Paenibacillus sp.]|nr:rane protein [Paenibacillus sp.]
MKGCYNLPSNKKEEIIFGLMMVLGMVSIMFAYNATLEGLWEEMTLVRGFAQFALTFIVAFIMEAFVVGTTARKIALKLPYNKSKKFNNIIAISTCMVIGMVSVMSVYGLISKIATSGIEGTLLSNYTNLLLLNFVVAYPAQLLIVGPVARYILTNFVKPSNNAVQL